MDDIPRLSIECTCSRLCNAYALRIDALDYEGFADLWSEDAAKGACYTIAYRVQNGLGNDPALLSPLIFLMDCYSVFKRDPKRGWSFSKRELHATMAGEPQILALRDQPWAPRAKIDGASQPSAKAVRRTPRNATSGASNSHSIVRGDSQCA